MEKSLKKFVSIFLVVAFLVLSGPIGGLCNLSIKSFPAITAEATSVKEQLDSFISRYPSGSRWT